MEKTDLAYNWVKERILNGTFPPLCDLSEEAIQQALGISRTPVRQAFLRLEKEDFVYIYPHKGTFVTDVTQDLLNEIYHVRALNEPYVFTEAMRTVDTAWLKKIRGQLTDPPADCQGEALRLYYIQLDDELHRTILSCCGNRYLRRTLSAVYDQFCRIRFLVSTPTQKDDHGITEHLQIIDAYLSQDEQALSAAVSRHIASSYQLVLALFRDRRMPSSF
jgi:DNA-binding GntR family transcriptional regulator